MEISVNNMREEYRKAQKKGQREFRARVAKGAYPYLQVLDEILENTQIERVEPLGLVDIPMEAIAGTKTSGRTKAFAANFMPLLGEATEFARKWMALCEAHMEEGIRDPIKAYEFMNRFYVQEGNKRVSVMKHFGAASIPGTVTRLVPRRSGSKGSEIYYEFLDFYEVTHVNFVWFSETGRFARLLKLVDAGEEKWSEDTRRDFSSVYYTFDAAFAQQGGKKLPITTGDALLMFLDLYPYRTLIGQPAAKLSRMLAGLWPEVTALTQESPVELSMQPEERPAPLLTRLLPLEVTPLHVAFVHEKSADTSAWAYAHEFGRSHVDEALEGRVITHTYDNAQVGTNDDEKIEQAIRDGCAVVFTTTPKLMDASLRAAARHPQVKILNCSMNMPHPSIRTYYGRLYEAKFVLGAIAGSLADNNKIGYFATYPIYGMPASINAFALGAKMVNPRARVYVQWTADKHCGGKEAFERRDIRVISGPDTGLSRGGKDYGLYLLTREGALPMAMAMWHWGQFYEKILRSILNNTWKADEPEDGRAVNYWWGIASGMIDVLTSRGLPAGCRRLADYLKKGVCDGVVDPFEDVLYAQGGRPVGPESGHFTPQEILTMDWLAENVDGAIPAFDDLIDAAKPMVRLQGVRKEDSE